jgi:hypothetical protein
MMLPAMSFARRKKFLQGGKVVVNGADREIRPACDVLPGRAQCVFLCMECDGGI